MTTGAVILLFVKVIGDFAFGHKALREVRAFRVAVSTRLDQMEGRLGHIENRLEK